MGTPSRLGIIVALVVTGGVGYYAGRESVKSEIRQKLGSVLEDIPSPVLQQSSARDPMAPSNSTAASSGWQISETKSPMDDSRTVTLSLDANESIVAWPSESHTPTLMIRCKEKETNVYIVNGTAPNVEYGNSDGATVRLRYDSLPAVEQGWSKSTDDKALFAPSPVATARKLADATKLTYQFTPFNSSPQTTTFTLSGLPEKLASVAEACGWKLTQ